MDKLVLQAQTLLAELQGVVDKIRVAFLEANDQYATLEPKMASLAEVEKKLFAANTQYNEVAAKLKAVTDEYSKLRAKFQ